MVGVGSGGEVGGDEASAAFVPCTAVDFVGVNVGVSVGVDDDVGEGTEAEIGKMIGLAGGSGWLEA